MGWASAIRNQKLEEENIRLRGQLERQQSDYDELMRCGSWEEFQKRVRQRRANDIFAITGSLDGTDYSIMDIITR